MKSRHFVPIAVLALAIACTENGSNPNDPELSKGGNPGNPAYQYSNYSVSSNGLTLSNAFKEVGLGSFSSVDYALTAHFSATAQCYNKATKEVSGKPFDFPADASSSTTEIPKAGQVTTTKTLTVSAPATCPNSPSAQFSVQLSNIVWSDIKFCWGQFSLTQGPVPQKPGDGSFTMVPGQSELSGSGDVTPLSGNLSTADGIFSITCAAGAAS
jgi:hypothetical protein